MFQLTISGFQSARQVRSFIDWFESTGQEDLGYFLQTEPERFGAMEMPIRTESVRYPNEINMVGTMEVMPDTV